MKKILFILSALIVCFFNTSFASDEAPKDLGSETEEIDEDSPPVDPIVNSLVNEAPQKKKLNK